MRKGANALYLEGNKSRKISFNENYLPFHQQNIKYRVQISISALKVIKFVLNPQSLCLLTGQHQDFLMEISAQDAHCDGSYHYQQFIYVPELFGILYRRHGNITEAVPPSTFLFSFNSFDQGTNGHMHHQQHYKSCLIYSQLTKCRAH